MIKFSRILLIMLILTVAPLSLSHAITVQVAPNPVEVNQPVTITATASFPFKSSNCQLEINLDDRRGWVGFGAICTNATCTRTTTTTFKDPGSYTIQVRSNKSICGPDFPLPPDPGKTVLTVKPPPLPRILCPTTKTLPGGTAGLPYTHQLRARGGTPPFTYRIASNRLPAGLTMSRTGRISGVPVGKGTFRFIVRIQDTVGQFVECPFSLTVKAAPLTVRGTPDVFTLRGDKSVTRLVTYSLSSNQGINTNITSKEGVFIAGGQTIRNNVSLKGRLANGTGKIMESITIPAEIIRKVLKLGLSKFFYSRTFTSDLTGSARSRLTFFLTKGALPSLEITGIRLYFDNKRPKITVKRNQKGLKVFAEIQFTGEGVLDGQFEVNRQFHSRIVRYINSKQRRTVTIETPSIHPIRTFDEGTHVTRLVINNPKTNIEFPEAIYYVVAAPQLPVVLNMPENHSVIDPSTQKFKWSAPGQNLFYRIEFSFKTDGPAHFSAETDKNEYQIPNAISKAKMLPGKEIFWRVRAFDRDGNLTGESKERLFITAERTSHVPGQIIVTVQNSDGTRKILDELGARYGLRLLKDIDLTSLNQKMAVFHTAEDIWPIIEDIKKKPSIYLAQPNLIFKTLADPLSHIQNTYRILNLEKLHRLYRGKGVKVSIIDTGADPSHKDLKERIIGYENLVDPSPYKGEIHGTATASLIAASINGFGIVGVAPEADLLILRACRQLSDDHPEGECYTTSIARALDIAIQERSNVVNMSVGSPATDPLISRLLEEGSKKNMIFVAPVGNQPLQETVVFPASHPDVLAVAGLTDLDKPYPNSLVAKLAGAHAPATNVLAAVPGQAHRFLNGTSMASATVAGLITIAWERNQKINMKSLPFFDGNLCEWGEDLLETKICDE